MSDIKQEKLINNQPSPVSVGGTRKILFQMEKYICKIYLGNGKKGTGTGFFCKIPFQNKVLPVLITNNHILDENDIKNGKIIKLSIYDNNIKTNKSNNEVNNEEIKIIKIDNSRKKYTNPDNKIDISIIEIKSIDKINYFLEYDKDIINKNEEFIKLDYKNKSIYILHYPNGELNVSYGLINDIIDKKIINHKCCTEEGSSGSPILLLETFKVIGIHYCSGLKNINLNYGTFIKYAKDLFNNKYHNNNEIIIKQKENILKMKQANNFPKKISDTCLKNNTENSVDIHYKKKTETNSRRNINNNNINNIKLKEELNIKPINSIQQLNKNNNNDMLRSNQLQVKNVPNVNVQKNEEKNIPIENEKVNSMEKQEELKEVKKKCKKFISNSN